MAKDKANIFKLSKEMQQEYKDNHFFDCTPGADDFAECLRQNILTKETPYVTLLDSHFGMGKTYFCTRFTQYLRDKDIHAIYFSAWENDYLTDPFLSFSKEITKYFYIDSFGKKAAKLCDKTLTAMKDLTVNLAGATSISAGLNLGIEAKVGVCGDKVVQAFEKLFDEFKEEKDAIQTFKEEFTSFIDNLPEKRLVLIVDELDRCRPDYAMKTLEIIKHFFDIEGLFIIVPTNEDSLNKCVISLYGNFESNKDSECYFNKFFNQRENLYEPDYHKMVEDYLTADKLENEITFGKLSNKINAHNSFCTLQEKLASYGETKRLTIREMTYACEKAIYICKYTSKRINSEYIAYVICKNFSKNDKYKCELPNEHPFHPSGEKQKLLTFQVPSEVYTFNNIIYQQDFYNKYPEFQNRQYKSYKEYLDFMNKIYGYFEEGFPRNIRSGRSYDYERNLVEKKDFFIQAEENIQNYREQWGSDDDDDEVKNYYDKISRNEYYIHSK